VLSTQTFLASSLLPAFRTPAAPEAVALRDLAWDVATRCAADKDFLVDRVDWHLRVWAMLPHWGKQDVQAFITC